MHRVVTPDPGDTVRPRLSVPFVHQPNDAVIECTQTYVTPANSCRYDPVVARSASRQDPEEPILVVSEPDLPEALGFGALASGNPARLLRPVA